MSDVQQPNPGWVPPQGRPKGKRKWPWIVLGVCALMFGGCGVLAVAAGSQVADQATKSPESPAPAAPAGKPADKPAEKKPNTDPSQGVVGKPVTNAGMTYTVTKAAKKTSLPFDTKPEDGAVFVVVDLTLLNQKDETKTFLEANAKLVSGGTKFETSSKTALAFGDKSLMLKDVQPGLPTKGTLGFEVPAAKVKGAALVVEDLWGNGEVTIALGL